jgi:hypothetical protein
MFSCARRPGAAIAALLVPCSRRPRGAAAVLLVSLAVAGCSSSDGDAAPPASTPTASQGVDPAGPSPAPASSTGPAVAVSRAPAVRIGEIAPLSDDVRVALGKVRELTVKAEPPGERAGSAVAVRVTVRNRSAKPFSLTGMAVTASYNRGTPGDSTSSGPAKELTGSLAPGGLARGTYVFMVPKKHASSLRVEVTSDESPTIVQFRR